MTEKNRTPNPAFSTQKNSVQLSALGAHSNSFWPSTVEFQRTAGPEEKTPPVESPHCRIVCDETPEEFRLTLCRMFCAGVCPQHKAFQEQRTVAVANDQR